MSINVTCGRSGTVITGETEEELVVNVQAHAREHEHTELSRDRILAEIRSAAHKLCDTSDMVIVHRMLRRECALLPKLVAGVPRGDAARARTVARHAREVLTMLHHHHVGEDELLWPRLSARILFDTDLISRMNSQHQGLAALVEQAMITLSEWQNAPAAHTSTPLAALLELLSKGLDEHFDEEEAVILPIVERVITAAEYRELGQRGLASIPLTRRLAVLAYLLEDATPRERADFLAAVPAPARLAYRLVGVRQHRHEATRLRGSLRP